MEHRGIVLVYQEIEENKMEWKLFDPFQYMSGSQFNDYTGSSDVTSSQYVYCDDTNMGYVYLSGSGWQEAEKT